VVAEAVVEGLLVGVEDLVDAELVNGVSGEGCRGEGEEEASQKSQAEA
jgi:hypothetical protein